ncbi:MAG: hypothetical protein DRI34_09245 [Deltaproteobacteria bacterium]|nr:MAG: hypothetical protein DRI34_09245 [Deltaproteobacteria bacterium]
MMKKKGNYIGTEIDRKWWKRYRGESMLARGNGEFWMDEKGIRFHRLLTRIPLLIGWEEMKLASLGKWHAGRWVLGRPVLKIDFERKGQKLCAGFYLSEDWQQMAQLASDLNKRIQRSGRA